MVRNVHPIEVEVALSMESIGAYALPGQPTWPSGIAELEKYLPEVGAANYEGIPTEATMMDAHELARTPGGRQRLALLYGSLRLPTYRLTTAEDARPIDHVAQLRGMQCGMIALSSILELQRALPEAVPAVYDPATMPELMYHDFGLSRFQGVRPFGLQVVHYSPETKHGLRVQNDAELIEEMDKLGIRGFVADPTDFRRAFADSPGSSSVMDKWIALMRSARVYEMHLTPGWHDHSRAYPIIAEQSRKELAAFASESMYKANSTQLAEMITEGIRNWLPPDELQRRSANHPLGYTMLRAVVHVPPTVGNLPQRKRQHQQVIEQVGRLVQSGGGRPIFYENRRSNESL